MRGELPPTVDRESSAASAFWWRLADNTFRRWFLFLLPIVLFAGLGVLQSTKTLEVYRSDGLLNVTSNPLVDDPVIGGAPVQFWETPSDVTSRTLDEQLQTDAFVETVAEGAGLLDAVNTGFLELDVVRASVWASSSGSSLVTVSATWADPETSLALVQATVNGYQAYIADTVATEANEAVDFYTEQLAGYEADVQAAKDALTTFADALPELEDGEEMALADSLELGQLTNEVQAAELKVTTTEENIENAQLNVRASRSEAGRSLTVVDPPELPTAPESTTIDRLITIVSYTVLGIAVAVAALLVSTVLDRSIVSHRDLVSLPGVSFVAAVPVVRSLRDPAASSGRLGGRKKRRTRRVEPPAPDVEPVDEPVRAGV